MNAIHFISGTPRSGSTLLSALLRQNPALHAHMTTPVLAMQQALYSTMGATQEWSAFITDAQRARAMRSALTTFYEDVPAEKIIFDTNRGWSAKLPTIATLFPDARVIACVREFSWVIDSFERLFTQNPLVMSKLFNLDNGMTAYARADTLSGLYGPVGFAWHAVREALYGAHGQRMILVDYEALTRDPARTMEYLYRVLGLAPFQHDFDNIEFDAADEFDAQFGLPGMHRVRRKVEYVERRTILPPELFDRFRGMDYWKAPEFAQLGIPMCVWSRG
jgi:sulfotransferase